MLALQCGSAHLVPKSHGWEGPITETEKVEVQQIPRGYPGLGYELP